MRCAMCVRSERIVTYTASRTLYQCMDSPLQHWDGGRGVWGGGGGEGVRVSWKPLSGASLLLVMKIIDGFVVLIVRKQELTLLALSLPNDKVLGGYISDGWSCKIRKALDFRASLRWYLGHCFCLLCPAGLLSLHPSLKKPNHQARCSSQLRKKGMSGCMIKWSCHFGSLG